MRKSLLAVAACLALAAPAFAQTAPDTSWVRRSAIYEVFVRDFSFSGDFQGVIRGLDRIQSSGANVIWLMPIHPIGVQNRKGPLGSPYAPRDFEAVDSAFGTMAEFRSLVHAVHDRGMKLILDWVPDHTGWDHVWVKQHPDYYVHDSTGALSLPRDPDGHLTDWSDVVQLDYTNQALRRAMVEAMEFWLDRGIDGFRVDAAGFVPDDFWREAVPALRAHAPRRILLLAEWADVRMHRLGFDLTYPWDSYARLKDVWGGKPAYDWVRQELTTLATMPAGGERVRFTTNHDETAWDNPPVVRFASPAGARAAYVAMALLPGRPLLYDGQEVESPQKLGLFVREAIAWNQPHADESRAFYRRVVDLARTDAAFVSGDFQPVATSDSTDVIAYRRADAVVLVNTRATAASFTVGGATVDGARDLLANAVQHGATVTLPGYGAVVLRLPRGQVQH